MTRTTQLAVCLGLLAGSLTLAEGLAIAPAARADIPITGGKVTGDAAFFTQSSGAPVLFDTAIQTLRIVTPNGTTTTSRFLPNASRFTDVNGNNRPDAGDRGRLEGALSGVAFSSTGTPVFFQNIPTALNFTLTSFSTNFIDGGSLISPTKEGTAPLVFLPGLNVKLSDASSASYTSKLGLLEVGPFAANLTGDFIGLPSDLQFRPSANDTAVLPVTLGRRIKFDFEGKDAKVDSASFGTDPTSSEQALDFEGEVTNFKIQSVGTPGTQEFKIDGSGTLDIALTAPFDVKKSDLNLNTLSGLVDYRIKGEGPGFITFAGANSISYSGTSRRDTDFKFEQGSSKFEGKSSGDVSFNLRDRRDNVNYNSFTVIAPVVTGVGTASPSVSSTGSTGSTGSAGSTGSTSGTSASASFTASLYTSTSVIIFPGYSSLLSVQNNNDSYGRNYVYYVYQPKKQTTEVVVERDGDLILLVDRTEVKGRKLKKKGEVVAAYKVVGLPSRVFPGLTGLRQLPPETVQTSSVEAGTTTAEATPAAGSTATAIAPAAVNSPEVGSPSATTPSTMSEATIQPDPKK